MKHNYQLKLVETDDDYDFEIETIQNNQVMTISDIREWHVLKTFSTTANKSDIKLTFGKSGLSIEPEHTNYLK